MGVNLEDIDQFLSVISKLEKKIHHLVHKSNLTDLEKKLILDNIVIIPSTKKKC
jgi:hypothetical protein